MREINFNTGIGYYRDQLGRIVSKFDFAPGKRLVDNSLDVIEVNSRAELDAVMVDEILSAEEIARRNEINQKDAVRGQALARLKIADIQSATTIAQLKIILADVLKVLT